jgi:hypothetical protein
MSNEKFRNPPKEPQVNTLDVNNGSNLTPLAQKTTFEN